MILTPEVFADPKYRQMEQEYHVKYAGLPNKKPWERLVTDLAFEAIDKDDLLGRLERALLACAIRKILGLIARKFGFNKKK